jgi:aspartate ammonia-lyase
MQWKINLGQEMQAYTYLLAKGQDKLYNDENKLKA